MRTAPIVRPAKCDEPGFKDREAFFLSLSPADAAALRRAAARARRSPETFLAQVLAGALKDPKTEQQHYEEQGGRCKICGVPLRGGRQVLDYFPRTGTVRGLLCSECKWLIDHVEGSTKNRAAASAMIWRMMHELKARRRRGGRP